MGKIYQNGNENTNWPQKYQLFVKFTKIATKYQNGNKIFQNGNKNTKLP
jgi:hypothetical protein